MTTPTYRARPRRVLAALALAAGLSLILAGCSGSTKPSRTVTATAGPSSSGASSSASASSSVAATPVHVGVNLNDGTQVGVGMPIIAYFKAKITDGRAFAQATKVTVNGSPITGAWYFEYADPATGYLMEAHYRPQTYWPAHAQIHLDLPVKGLSGGDGFTFDNSLTVDFSTGPANISTVDDATHQMTVTTDGAVWGKFPVSLGAANTPTLRGVKVIMEKGRDISMRGPGYYDPHVKYTQRLTYGGEYLHAAPWNLAHIGNFDSSNGCTNLTPADAQRIYAFLQVGDVVTYPNAKGPLMQLGQGYGDWNLPWSLWQTGGAINTA